MSTPPPPRPPRRRPMPSQIEQANPPQAGGSEDGSEATHRKNPYIIITLIFLLMLVMLLLLVTGSFAVALVSGVFSSGSANVESNASDDADGNLDEPFAPVATPAPADSPDPADPADPAKSSDDTEPTPAPTPPQTQVDDRGGGSATTGTTHSIPGGEFFGISAEGTSFVYIVDYSGSMEGSPIERAKKELLRSVNSLTEEQTFFVIFFNDQDIPMLYPDVAETPLPTTADNRRKLASWVATFNAPDGGTNPGSAFVRALAMKPQVIYLLTDGEFDPSVARVIQSTNQNGCQINTVSFINRDGEPLLKQISSQNNGKYIHVP